METIISKVKDATTVQCETLSLREALEEIRSRKYTFPVLPVRLAETKEAAERSKRGLPMYLFSGIFTTRRAAALEKHSGYICVDFDDVESPGEKRGLFAKDPHVASTFISPSGNGLKVLYKVDPQYGHVAAFESLKSYIERHYDLKLDSSCKDVARGCFVSDDPDCYIAEDFDSVVAIEVVNTVLNPEARNESRKGTLDRRESREPESKIREALFSIKERPQYDDWLRIISAVWSEIGSEGTSLLKEWMPEEKTGEYEYKYENRLIEIKIATLYHYAKKAGWVWRGDRNPCADSRSADEKAKIDETDELVEIIATEIEKHTKRRECSKTTDINDREAHYPKNTLIEDWIRYSKQFSEVNIDFLLGCILSVCSAVLGRNIWIEFAGKKFPNLYIMLVAPPGMRKSTTINPAESLAREVLPPEGFTSTMTSIQALFEQYDPEFAGCPRQFLIEDEGNAVLAYWKQRGQGEEVSKRYLKLYDCPSWNQSYKQNKELTNNGVTRRLVEDTSTTVLLGATLDGASFSGVAGADGMRRRFLFHLCLGYEGSPIIRPKAGNSEMFDRIADKLRALSSVRCKFDFSEEAERELERIQLRNRREANEIPAFGCSDNIVRKSALAEEVSHIIKIAMIYSACEMAEKRSPSKALPGTVPLEKSAISTISTNSTGETAEISAEAMKLADQHVRRCLDASVRLDAISRIAENQKEAERIYDTVFSQVENRRLLGRILEIPKCGKGIVVSKSDLTSKFCPHGRKGHLDVHQLYKEVIPELIAHDKCVELPKTGKLQRYCFYERR